MRLFKNEKEKNMQKEEKNRAAKEPPGSRELFFERNESFFSSTYQFDNRSREFTAWRPQAKVHALTAWRPQAKPRSACCAP
jgi:hypothetical protein